jgi:hypothetical protein
LISAELIVGQKSKLGPVLFKGVALSYNDDNKLRLSVLNAGTTAYAFNPDSPITEVRICCVKILLIHILVPAGYWKEHDFDWRTPSS